MQQILTVPDGDHADGNRLLLRVRGNGTRASWVYRFTSPVSGTRKELGLGSAKRDDAERAQAAAASAREMALEYELKLLRGTDPAVEIAATKAQQREQAAAEQVIRVSQARTLGRAIRDYHENEIEPSPKFSDRHKRQWLSPFENHLRRYRAAGAESEGPLWRKPISEVGEIDVLDWLKDLQRRRPHTARKARQRLDSVFEHGALHGWNTGRPTQAIVRALRKYAPPMKNKHLRALPFTKAPELMRRLKQGDSTAARCLRFAVLTASRTGEAISAEWSEFDLEAGVWTVPAERMKTSDEAHRVDLSPQALAILEQQKGLHPKWVFPSPAGKEGPLSNMAMLELLKRMDVNRETTVHGLARGSFSTWANETGAARPDVIEAALAHREADLIRAAYNRAGFIAERRALLAAWADYLEQPEPAGNVLEFAAQRVA